MAAYFAACAGRLAAADAKHAIIINQNILRTAANLFFDVDPVIG